MKVNKRMSISLYDMRRWIAMLSGKSIYHVDQGIGQVFSANEMRGYYNDLTKKVLLGDGNLEQGLPVLIHSNGQHIQMPTMIFQYGLGAYDLWLLSNKNECEYFEKAVMCADWAVEKQEQSGAWNNFFYIYPDHPYSAMPQGEGVSLLLRIFKETGDERYLLTAKKAVNYMLLPVEDGGVCKKSNSDLYLLEYTHKAVVLNGWIFALWGLKDMLYFDNCSIYSDAYSVTVGTLVKKLPEFDCGYWSMYNDAGMITSPFYHNLHIAQMEAMYELTKINTFNSYANKWRKVQESKICYARAFIKKGTQKILE